MSQKKDLKGRNLKTGEGQRENGMYRYRYTDIGGVRKEVYSWKLVPSDPLPKGKKSCLSLREMEKNIALELEKNPINRVADKTTVHELILIYLQTRSNLSNSTLQNYTDIIKRDIAPTDFAKMKISEVRKSDVQRYYAYLNKEKKLSVSTIHIYHSIISPAFQLAVDDDILRKNPCNNCMKDYPTGTLSSNKKALTRQEQTALLDFLKNSTVYNRYYPIVAFMLGTGCRIGETLGLTWEDIDFENKMLSVNHQIIYKKNLSSGKCETYIEKPKNKLGRMIPLQNDVLKILNQHKQRTYFSSLYNPYTLDGYSHFVFLNSNMKPYLNISMVQALYRIRDAYNRCHDEENGDVILPHFSAHTFRHTFCTRMAENGIDVKVLQKIMGHQKIEVTMQVYNHAQIDRIKAEVEKIPSVLAV